jgi:hypothetical protein
MFRTSIRATMHGTDTSSATPRRNRWRPFSETLQFISAITGRELGPRVVRGAVGRANNELIDAEADKVVGLLGEGARLSLDASNTLPTGGEIPGLHADEVVSSRQALARLDMSLRLQGHPDWTSKLANQEQRDAVAGALMLRESDVQACEGRSGDSVVTAGLQIDDATSLLANAHASLGHALEEYGADKGHPNYTYLEQLREAALEALTVVAMAGASPADKAPLIQRSAQRLNRSEAVENDRTKAGSARRS